MVYNKSRNNRILVFAWFCFAVYFVLAFLPTTNYTAPQNTWLDFASYEFEQIEEKDENNNVKIINLISTPNQLAGLFCLPKTVKAENHSDLFLDVNNFRLANNIDLKGYTWQPTALSKNNILDGVNFKIYNLKIASNSGNVGFVSENNGTIKNLTFVDASVSNSATNGSACNTGIVAGTNYGTIENCTIYGSVSGNVYVSNKDRTVGGICGWNKGGTISNCYNYAMVNQGKYLGGITGKQSETNAKIENCKNNGNVKSLQKNASVFVGGICGQVLSGKLTNCLNNAVIIGKATESGDSRIGGIAGASYVKISNCGNTANVNGGEGTSSLPSYVGGIVGFTNANVENCYNMANVSAYANSTSTTQTLQNSADEKIIHRSGFLNVHEITYDEGSTTKYTVSLNAFAGGIVGKPNTRITVSNSYSYGDIIGGFKYVYYSFSNIVTGSEWGRSIVESHRFMFGYFEDVYCANITNGTAYISNCVYVGDYERTNISNGLITLQNDYGFFKFENINKLTMYHYSNFSQFASFTEDYINENDFILILDKNQSFKFNYSYGLSGFNNDPTLAEAFTTSNGQFKLYYASTNCNKINLNNESIIALTTYNKNILNNGLSSTLENLKNGNVLSKMGGSSIWSVNENINNGYPYLNSFYWEGV